MDYDYGAMVVRVRATEETVAALKRKNGRINAFMGNAVHQAMHGSIHTNAAEVLHDPQIAQQPFATNTLFRWQLDMQLRGPIALGEMGWVRFVALHPYVLQELETYRRSNPRVIEIDRVPWQVMHCTWSDHLYADRCHAAHRFYHHTHLAAPRLIRLRFLTPTYFKSKKVEFYLQPDPRLVFAEGLLRRWTSFYTAYLPPDGFAEFVQAHVHLRNCIAYTPTSVMLKGAVLHGFTGDVVYTIDIPSDRFLPHAQFLGLLAEYATFAGVGKKTTMGLGMIDRVQILRSVAVPALA